MKNICTFLAICLLCVGVANAAVDNFDSYTPGNVHGQGPWLDFGGDLTTDVTTAQALSAPHSLAFTNPLTPNAGDTAYGSDAYIPAIAGTTLTTGQWELSMQLFVPSDFDGTLDLYLSQGEMPGTFQNGAWLVADNVADAALFRTKNGAISVPLILDQWVPLSLSINLDADTVTTTYNNAPFSSGAWDLEGPNPPSIGGINIWADGADGDGAGGGTANGKSVYIDDLSLTEVPEPASVSLLIFAGLFGLVFRRRK